MHKARSNRPEACGLCHVQVLRHVHSIRVCADSLQSAASALLAPLLRYVTDALAMSWRRRLTAAAHRRYLSGSTFYTASQLAGMQVMGQGFGYSPSQPAAAAMAYALMHVYIPCNSFRQAGQIATDGLSE